MRKDKRHDRERELMDEHRAWIEYIKKHKTYRITRLYSLAGDG
jgi:hypothetical protein